MQWSHIFEHQRGDTSPTNTTTRMQSHEPQRRKTNVRAESTAPHRGSYFLFRVYPGFHIGLCPHSTLGFAGVSCLKALIISLNFDALTLIAFRKIWSSLLKMIIFAKKRLIILLNNR